MGSKKLNLNKILSAVFGATGIMLVGIFIAICLLTPLGMVKASALTKSTIVEEYNINFRTAKTKVRNAHSYTKNTEITTVADQLKSAGGDLIDTYVYEYNTFNPEYYVVNSSVINSKDYGTVELISRATAETSGSHINTITPYSKDDGSLSADEKSLIDLMKDKQFIPEGTTHFKNSKGNLEEVLYDEINNDDFVMLDNYNVDSALLDNKSANTSADVENFYVAFGTPEDDFSHSTPLSLLEVEAYLYSKDGKFLIETPVGNVEHNGKTLYYYNQYFDLRNLQVKNAPDSPVYNLKNCEGRYEFKFKFTRYDKNLEPEQIKQEEFIYSFYLLDSANYNSYPTFSNADRKVNEYANTDEYFYSFNKEFPILTYNPERLNVSFHRENNEVVEDITSTFTTTTYVNEANSEIYPMGIITYYLNDDFYKKVYVLTYYNSEISMDNIEYLYLSDLTNTNAMTNISGSQGYSYNKFMDLVKKDTLSFEYKRVVQLNATTNKIFTYKFADFDNLAWNNNPASPTSNSEYTYTDKTTQYDLMNMLDWEKVNAGGTATPTLNIEYSYDLVLNEIGGYQFNYSYVCPTGNGEIENYIAEHHINANRNLIPSRYYATLQTNGTPETETESTNTILRLSGYFDAQGKLKLLDTDYIYNKNTKNLEIKNQETKTNHTISPDGTWYDISYKLGNVTVDTKHSIKEDESGIRLIVEIVYGTQINSVKTSEIVATPVKEFSKFNSISSYASTLQNPNLTSANIGNGTQALSPLFTLLSEYESIVSTDGVNPVYTFEDNYTSSIIYGEDKLHIFGSIAYFSKKDTTTDSGYSKMELKNSKYHQNYFADITSQVTGLAPENCATIRDNALALIQNKSFNKDNMIFTDMQVMWKNFSSLSYGDTDNTNPENNKISNSFIYKYNYSLDANENIIPGSLISTERFTKDTYCQNDGLYIIVVLYNYQNYPTPTTTFYQVFSFIIDNSAPSMSIELENEDGTYEPISYNKYTNKNVKISWEIASHFKNNVFIEVNKKAYATGDLSFTASYDGQKSAYNAELNSFSPSNMTGNISYINTISSFGKDTTGTKYEVIFKLPDTNPNNYNIDGTYSIKLYYGDENIDGSKPNISEQFIIDTKPIDGLHILPIMEGYDNDGNKTFLISDYVSLMKENQQIINTDFTFRYNPKKSQATIYTYWYKIPLTNYSDYQQIVHAAERKLGITTNMAVAGDNAENESKSKQYIYDYNLNSSQVNEENRFIGNGSALYLFEMYDDAGNTCRYVVFYDTTSPMVIVTPKPENSNNIVSDVTQVLWGDYKAIKINTAASSLNIHAGIDNYNKADGLKNIDEVLSYINNYNTYNNFNNTRVERIGENYYVLVPIETVQVKDEQNYIEEISNNKDFYFFPSAPYDNEERPTQINLPIFSTDGKIQSRQYYNLVANSLQSNTITDTYGNPASTYLSASYNYTSSQVNKVNGVYGEGVYLYTAYDGLGNKGGGNLWMNLDKTQTMIYGTFDYDSTIAEAMGLVGSTAKAYSLAKMYISSLQNIGQNKSIPSYTLTYQYFPLNTNFYKTYTIISARLEEVDNSVYDEESGDLISPDTDNSTYLVLTVQDKNSPTVTKEIKYLYTDSEGQFYPARTFPYDLEGETIIKDSNNKPMHIYSESLSTYETENNGKTKRVYSSLTNATTDVNNGSLVTQEGFYILKREYSNSVTSEELGQDKKIVYRSYYVDRSGIINVTSSANASSALFNIGEDLQFELGKDSSQDSKYEKLITAENIQNNTILSNQALSNTTASSSNLFKTNKVEVEFSLTADKFNYDDKFYKLYDLTTNNLSGVAEELERTIFNSAEVQRIFKLDLKFSTMGNSAIINETDDKNPFNDTLMAKYLHDYTVTTNSFNQRVRDNYLTMFYGTGNNYVIELSDQSGYIQNDDPSTPADEQNNNKQANILTIDFNINHQSPYGDTYGKYYGTHDYDESSSTSSSIPLLGNVSDSGINGNYQLISRYLKGTASGQKGQLKLLSETQNTTYSPSGTSVQLVSTNNETLVFLFTITNDEYMAQIDINNIKVYKDGLKNDNLIFNRVNGVQQNAQVDAARQQKSFIKNTINGVDYYAIIVFDNNLDDILDADEILQGYGDFRLLDAVDNNDEAKYYIQIQYLGNQNNYQQETTNGTQNYFKSTYEVTIDRIKPMYNLSKLMYLDKYFYNANKSTAPNITNYEELFADWYKNYYGERLDKNTEYNVEFIRSDLENYFFAVDTRQVSLDGTDDITEGAFVFESIDKQDSNKSLFIRSISNINNYKFSFTPDDYEAYNSALYRGSHPQFVPENATIFSSDDEWRNTPLTDSDGYYEFNYDENGKIDLSKLVALNVLELGGYYEIIEQDEAGNYRVYGIYLANSTTTTLDFNYQAYANGPTQRSTLTYTNSTASVSGMNLNIESFKSSATDNDNKYFDKFLKAIINIKSTRLNVTNYITYDPIKKILKITDGSNKQIELIENVSNEDSATAFINKINSRLNYYHAQINNKLGLYYSQYGYTVDVDIVDRIGIPASYDKKVLTNYEIDYIVAGSILEPKFADQQTNFLMFIPALTGSTYITSINVYKFNKSWNIINEDTMGNLFNKQPSEFRAGNDTHPTYGLGTQYFLNKGVYKVEVTDNFNRTNIYFHEYGISSSQTGGSLRFAGAYQTYNDYIYSSNQIQYVYDSSVYDVYIRYTGRVLSTDEMVIDKDIFNSYSYDKEKLKEYGIAAITTSGSTTTIVFAGVNYLNKYQIKTILASTSTGYTWGDEATNSNIFVYNNKIAIYTGLPSVAIKNMKGNILDSSSNNLNLTEDFELITSWANSGVASEDRLNFDAKIVLTRTYNLNGTVRTETLTVPSGYIVSKAGDYVAKVINNLGNTSAEVKFTRGEGVINMYAVYAVNKQNGTEVKLTPSTHISTIDKNDANSKTVFHYYITNDYLSYKDLITGVAYDKTNILDHLPDGEDVLLSSYIGLNKNAIKYVDIRVNSTLSIFADIKSIEAPEGDKDNFTVTYQIYSHQKDADGETDYTYRYICIHYVKPEDTKLIHNTIITNQTSGQKVTMDNNNIFQSVDTAGIKIAFSGLEYDGIPEEEINEIYKFNTIYIDRYYNNIFIESKILEITGNIEFNLSAVGLHTFKIRDLAGRAHEFVTTTSENYRTDTMYVYLVNQILFNVNDNTPINNQIFNETVRIDIISELENLKLYDNRYLGITVLKNGTEISVANNDGHLTFAEPGHYSVQIIAITDFANTREQITSNYNFEIVRTDIAKNSYSISKGSNFIIEKVVKTAGKTITDLTYEFTQSPDGNLNGTNSYIASLIWLSHSTQGNCTYEITLKSYDSNTNSYRPFTFKVWINNEIPSILSNVDIATKTTDTILLDYNPALIYSQVGSCRLEINGTNYINIDADSQNVVNTITISKAGEYVVKIISDDGSVISSYKYIKAEPMNNTTKIVLGCVAIGAVVLVVLFFTIRKKGKYR